MLVETSWQRQTALCRDHHLPIQHSKWVSPHPHEILVSDEYQCRMLLHSIGWGVTKSQFGVIGVNSQHYPTTDGIAVAATTAWLCPS